MAINFISSQDSDGTRTMYKKNNIIEIMVSHETWIIEELFKCLLQRYEKGLEKKKWEEVNFFMVMLIYCIINFIK